MRAPIGTIRDKLAVLRFRKSVRGVDPDELFTRPEVTAGDRLVEIGFSPLIIERFLSPLLSAITLDPTLTFSSRYLEFVFRMLTDGDAAVPADGMGAIAEQLVAGLPADTVRYGVEVSEATSDHVTVDGSRIDAAAVVIATDAADAARLTSLVTDRGSTRVTTWWFAAPEPPTHRPAIILGGRGDAINNLAVMTQVSDHYSDNGRALVAASSPGTDVTDEDVIRTLVDWFGPMIDEWEPVRTDRIVRAQPRQALGIDPDQSVRLADGLFVAGDHRQNASLDGALVSGRRAGEAVAAKLCRDC